MALLAAKDKGEKKLFGFAFSPLMRDDGTTLSDDIHELYVYKVRTWISFISIPYPTMAILKYNSHLSGFHWSGHRILGSTLVCDSRRTVGRL